MLHSYVDFPRLHDGCGIRQAARLTGVDKDTLSANWRGAGLHVRASGNNDAAVCRSLPCAGTWPTEVPARVAAPSSPRQDRQRLRLATLPVLLGNRAKIAKDDRHIPPAPDTWDTARAVSAKESFFPNTFRASA